MSPFAGLDGALACLVTFAFVAARSYADLTLDGVAAALVDVLEVESTRSTSRVLPFFVSATPALICPAPENWVNASEVLPTVIGSFVVSTHAESAFTEPSETNVNRPDVTSALTSQSVARDQEPAAAR